MGSELKLSDVMRIDEGEIKAQETPFQRYLKMYLEKRIENPHAEVESYQQWAEANNEPMELR